MRRMWAAGVIVCLLGSCAPPSDGISVVLDEYTVDAGKTTAGPGEVTFEAGNVGQIEHELVVLRTDSDPEDLPVKDGRVQTDARGIELVGNTDRIKAGGSQVLEVALTPGAYVLICNVPAHYQTGMRAPFRVS